MIEFIPLENYYIVFLYSAFAIALFTLLHAFLLDINEKKNISYINFTGYLILFFLTIYMGLRPISEKYFVDMKTYSEIYNHYALGGEITIKADIYFHLFMKICSSFLSVHGFFLMCEIIYIVPLYFVSKKYFSKYWFYAFFMFIVSFSFWTYGVNGIRNGMATSLVLLAISLKDKKALMILFFVLSCLFHQTMLLPIGAFVLTLFVNNSKWYIRGWLLAIPLSIALGSFWENLFASLGFADDRLSGYLTGEKDEAFANAGFRYDFLFYSSFAVIIGAYFIFIKKYKDPIFIQLFNIYLITNAFWILIIRANFSNRFAYLSWFLMPLVIVYPFLKERFFKKQHVVIGKVLFFYYLFTYFMFLYYNYR
ncbi:EpsG family protein [Mariniflexile soesokkakense]|uniref:EpsG family protein n=1 Tax=Mariniflexile soesokkakense TaxID=1343160 RepID=A0ABV0ACM3_9FLAO